MLTDLRSEISLRQVFTPLRYWNTADRLTNSPPHESMVRVIIYVKMEAKHRPAADQYIQILMFDCCIKLLPDDIRNQ